MLHQPHPAAMEAIVHLHLDPAARPLPATTRALTAERGFVPGAPRLRFARAGWPASTASGATFAERAAARAAARAAMVPA